MLILIDQDGPLADFEKGFLDIWQAQLRYSPNSRPKSCQFKGAFAAIDCPSR